MTPDGWLHLPSCLLGFVLGLTPFFLVSWLATKITMKTMGHLRDYQKMDRSSMPWGDETPWKCPVCGSWKTIGHRPNCKLGRDLARFEKETDA